jgi:hypothetical protein
MPRLNEIPSHPRIAPSQTRAGDRGTERPPRTGQTRFWLVVMGVCSAGLIAPEALRRML